MIFSGQEILRLSTMRKLTSRLDHDRSDSFGYDSVKKPGLTPIRLMGWVMGVELGDGWVI